MYTDEGILSTSLGILFTYEVVPSTSEVILSTSEGILPVYFWSDSVYLKSDSVCLCQESAFARTLSASDKILSASARTLSASVRIQTASEGFLSVSLLPGQCTSLWQCQFQSPELHQTSWCMTVFVSSQFLSADPSTTTHTKLTHNRTGCTDLYVSEQSLILQLHVFNVSLKPCLHCRWLQASPQPLLIAGQFHLPHT